MNPIHFISLRTVACRCVDLSATCANACLIWYRCVLLWWHNDGTNTWQFRIILVTVAELSAGRPEIASCFVFSSGTPNAVLQIVAIRAQPVGFPEIGCRAFDFVTGDLHWRLIALPLCNRNAIAAIRQGQQTHAQGTLHLVFASLTFFIAALSSLYGPGEPDHSDS